MKYLKSINELLKISDDEFDDIKDIFQDLVDEFDLEETIYDVVDTPGIYYKFDNGITANKYIVSRATNNYMLIFIIVSGQVVSDKLSRFRMLYSRLSDFKNRLRNMGYLVEYVDTIEYAIQEVVEFNDFVIRISLIS